MAKEDHQRWWDSLVNPISGRSSDPDPDDEPAPQQDSKKTRLKGQGWWWTMIGKEGICKNCEAALVPPQKIAYHHPTRRVFCLKCAEEQQIIDECRPSKKMQEMEEVAS